MPSVKENITYLDEEQNFANFAWKLACLDVSQIPLTFGGSNLKKVLAISCILAHPCFLSGSPPSFETPSSFSCKTAIKLEILTLMVGVSVFSETDDLFEKKQYFDWYE